MVSWRQRLVGSSWGIPRITCIAFALIAAVAVTGCGQGSTSGPFGNAAKPTNTASQPARAIGSATVTTSSSHATSGQVTLTMSTLQYGTEEPLLVTISNGLSQTIWIQTTPASCLGVVLQVQTSSGWQASGSCASARPAQSIAIRAGSTLVKRLEYAQGMDTGAGWPAGTYRVMLVYSLSQSAATSSGSSGATAYSSNFSIA